MIYEFVRIRTLAASISKDVPSDLHKYFIWFKESSFVNNTDKCAGLFNRYPSPLLDGLVAGQLIRIDHVPNHWLVPYIDAFLDCKFNLIMEFTATKDSIVQFFHAGFDFFLHFECLSFRRSKLLLEHLQLCFDLFNIHKVQGLTLLLQEELLIDAQTVE